MKKSLIITLIGLFIISSSAYARTTYNSDNTIKESSTIRGQERARQEMIQQKQEAQRQQVAAAAKIEIPEIIGYEDSYGDLITDEN